MIRGGDDYMSDTISRRQAIEALRRNQEAYLHDNYFDKIVETDIETLTELPSTQPDIIRCKDCKHWDGVDTCDVIDAPVWDNDFCSMAERRSDE
jgi:hypothetical protein